MSIREIPVHVIGPGSQPGKSGDTLTYIDMPGEMATFVAPSMPDPDDVEHMSGAREAMAWLQQALRGYAPGLSTQLANLSLLDDENRDLVNQILGEGEVSIYCDGEFPARIQESVLAGVWRTFYFDKDDNAVADLLEVADVPALVTAALDGGTIDTDVAECDHAAAGNALPILVELQSAQARFAADGTTHSVNLSLLPMSEDELEFLDRRLGRGPIDILSRAYGKCQVISTQAKNVWWVRYYNGMGTLILNTVEIARVPEVVAAAAEDLGDSAVRLREILAPYWTEGA
ncbi:MAG: hydrogenase expression/formation C-terminal domain-containing protein [Woeseiaceae bacterium]|nr:hydrogenase expression/formation C-terminal domain-containing protein [Woeseiaceae bacterium]